MKIFKNLPTAFFSFLLIFNMARLGQYVVKARRFMNRKAGDGPIKFKDNDPNQPLGALDKVIVSRLESFVKFSGEPVNLRPEAIPFPVDLENPSEVHEPWGVLQKDNAPIITEQRLDAVIRTLLLTETKYGILYKDLEEDTSKFSELSRYSSEVASYMKLPYKPIPLTEEMAKVLDMADDPENFAKLDEAEQKEIRKYRFIRLQNQVVDALIDIYGEETYNNTIKRLVHRKEHCHGIGMLRSGLSADSKFHCTRLGELLDYAQSLENEYNAQTGDSLLQEIGENEAKVMGISGKWNPIFAMHSPQSALRSSLRILRKTLTFDMEVVPNSGGAIYPGDMVFADNLDECTGLSNVEASLDNLAAFYSKEPQKEIPTQGVFFAGSEREDGSKYEEVTVFVPAWKRITTTGKNKQPKMTVMHNTKVQYELPVVFFALDDTGIEEIIPELKTTELYKTAEEAGSWPFGVRVFVVAADNKQVIEFTWKEGEMQISASSKAQILKLGQTLKISHIRGWREWEEDHKSRISIGVDVLRTEYSALTSLETALQQRSSQISVSEDDIPEL